MSSEAPKYPTILVVAYITNGTAIANYLKIHRNRVRKTIHHILSKRC